MDKEESNQIEKTNDIEYIYNTALETSKKASEEILALLEGKERKTDLKLSELSNVCYKAIDIVLKLNDISENNTVCIKVKQSIEPKQKLIIGGQVVEV